jgi:cell division protein FtsB
MKKLMNNVKKLIKRLIIVCIIIYAVITFFNQQKILNTYASNDAELDKKLVQAQEYQEELNKIKNNVNSNEYIEEVAREKLDMYLPNERVYLNQK